MGTVVTFERREKVWASPERCKQKGGGKQPRKQTRLQRQLKKCVRSSRMQDSRGGKDMWRRKRRQILRREARYAEKNRETKSGEKSCSRRQEKYCSWYRKAETSREVITKTWV